MAIHGKSPELLAAQVAAFSTEKLEHAPDRRHLMSQIGELAVAPVMPAQVERTLQRPEVVPQPDGSTETQAADTTRTVTAAEYVGFLREQNGANAEITHRAELLSNYEEFRDTIEAADAESIAHGGSSHVSIIEHDGQRYAVRETLNGDASAIDRHMLAAARVQGIEPRYRSHVEHIAAATYEEGGKTVANVMDGAEFKKAPMAEVAKFRPEHAEDFVGTLLALHDVNVYPDMSNPDNFFYDAQKGIGIIDLTTLRAGFREAPTTDEVLTNGTKMLATLGNGVGPSILKTAEDYKLDAQDRAVRLPALEAYAKVCATLPDDTLSPIAKEQVAKIVGAYREAAHDYANEAWVQRKLKAEQDARDAFEDGDDII